MDRTEQHILAEEAEDASECSHVNSSSENQLKVKNKEFDQVSLTTGAELHEMENWTILDAKQSISLARLGQSNHPQDSTNILNDNSQFEVLHPSLDVGSSSEKDTPEVANVPRTGDTGNDQLSPILCAKQRISLARRLREADLSLPHAGGGSSQPPKVTRQASHRGSHSHVLLPENGSASGGSAEDESETVVQVMSFYPSTMTMDDERERIIREAKQKLKAEVPWAEPVEMVPLPNSTRTPIRFVLAACSTLLVVICIVGVTVWRTSRRGKESVSLDTSPATRPPSTHEPTMAPAVYLEDGRRAFTTNQQLCAAVDEYLELQSKNELSETSELSVMYGYPIGNWDVSRLTNFNHVFANNRNETIDPSLGPSEPSRFDDDLSGWDTSNAMTMI
jgi:Mycoplasma protein of unknown function, DUF285